MRQLFFVHGGDSLRPGEDFFAHWDAPSQWQPENPFEVKEKKKRWKDTLPELLGAEWACAFPRMPNDMDAHYAQWKWWFDKHFAYAQDGIVLVGHSLGGNFFAKYLAENTPRVQVSQVHLVAPSWGEGDFILPSSLEGIQKNGGSVYIYASKDDPVVRFEDMQKYQTALPSAEFLTFEDRGHFLQDEFPEIVENIKKG